MRVEVGEQFTSNHIAILNQQFGGFLYQGGEAMVHALNFKVFTRLKITLDQVGFRQLWKASRRRWHMAQQSSLYSRRFTSRVEATAGEWVDWRCAGREEISRVRNLSLGGLFVETPESRGVGSTAKLEFLVKEGQVRAEAVVRRVEPSRGLAMKFTAVREEDRPRLEALINRLRYSS